MVNPASQRFFPIGFKINNLVIVICFWFIGFVLSFPPTPKKERKIIADNGDLDFCFSIISWSISRWTRKARTNQTQHTRHACMVAYPVGDYRLLPLNHCVPQRLHLSTRERCAPLALAPAHLWTAACTREYCGPPGKCISARSEVPAVYSKERKQNSTSKEFFFSF